ncbi:hydroxymethylbilane synthase [Gemmatimonadota bacterium]
MKQTSLRVGTRGSELALWQTRWVSRRLLEAHPSLSLEEVVIRTQGDAAPDESFDESWPVGAFVSALEHALLEDRIDVAVHSYKDLQTARTPGLVIAATPVREVPHDVLLARSDVSLGELPPGARIGTSSPRRRAQILRLGPFQVVPLRGNVPTRIEKLESEELDGVILAAAGLRRLGIDHPHQIALPLDRFLPAPAQGSLAVQVRVASEAEGLVALLEDTATRTCVTAERSFLKEINAGCHTPVGALATLEPAGIRLEGCLFSEDDSREAWGSETGSQPEAAGVTLARRLLKELED